MTTTLRSFLVLSLAASSAQQTWAQALPSQVRAAADRISGTQIAKDLDYLASDALRGRDTFTPGFDSAAQFVVRRLKRAGLKPLGDDGTFLQHYVVKEGTADTAAMFVEIDGRRFRFGEVLLFPFNRPLDATAEVVFVGHGARVPSMNIDAYAGVDVRGKVLLAQLVLPIGLSFNNLPRDIEGPRVVADKLGALAVLLIPTPQTLEAWSDIKAGLPYRSYVDLEPSVPRGRPRLMTSILLKPEQTRMLLAPHIGMADRILNRAPDVDFPPSFELARNVRVNVPTTEQRRSSYNVVAVIEGSDPKLKHEYVTVAAHLDGAVENDPLPGDSIYNAADDNASGSVGILTIAEQMMRAPRPRRSVMFIWDSGEERGLLGTHAFVGRKIVPMENIVAHFNIDMIGATAAVDSAGRPMGETGRRPAQAGEVFVTGPRVMSTELDSLVERMNRGYLNMRLNHKYDHADSSFFYPRTDATPFMERGIPAIQFFTGLHERYHRPNDEARYLDVKKIQDVSRTIMATVWAVANAPQRPMVDKGFPQRVVRVR